MKSAATSFDLIGAVGESSRKGSMSSVCLSVFNCQLAWPSQVSVGIGLGLMSSAREGQIQNIARAVNATAADVLVGLSDFGHNRLHHPYSLPLRTCHGSALPYS